MKCKKARAYFPDYIEKRLSGDLLKEFKNHIEECEKCRRELKEFKRFYELIGNEKETISPPPFSVLKKELFKEERKRFSFEWVYVFVLFFGIIIGVFLGKGIFSSNNYSYSYKSYEYDYTLLYDEITIPEVENGETGN